MGIQERILRAAKTRGSIGASVQPFQKPKASPKRKKRKGKKRRKRHEVEVLPERPSKKGEIREQSGFSEFELHAEVFSRCKAIPECVVRGEQPAVTHDGYKCRFDIVVFKANREPACIIECKAPGREMQKRQLLKYITFDVPIIEINSKGMIDKVIEAVGHHVRDECPPEWSDRFTHYIDDYMSPYNKDSGQ